MSQRARVLRVLADGRWHSTGEFLDLRITRAAARVRELRLDGHAIETRRRRSGFAEYRLSERAAGVAATTHTPAAPQPLPLEAFCFECGRQATGAVSGQWWCAEHLERGARPAVTDRLLTTRELAERLGLSTETVLRRWRAGEIPGYRLASNVLRFDPDEIDKWLLSLRDETGLGVVRDPSGVA